jgi:hypothetical protein
MVQRDCSLTYGLHLDFEVCLPAAGRDFEVLFF